MQAANVSINVSDLNTVNMDTLRERLHLPPSLIPRLVSKAAHLVHRSASMPASTSPAEESFPPMGSPRNPAVKRAASSEDQGRTSALSMDSLAHMPHIPSVVDEDDLPPPIPPKDPRKPNAASTSTYSKLMAVAFSSPPAFGYTQRKDDMGYPLAEGSYTPPRVPLLGARCANGVQKRRLACA